MIDILKEIVSRILFLSVFRKLINKNRIVILTYHRVLGKKDIKNIVIQPGMYVEIDAFEKQIKFIKKNYNVISLEKILNLEKRKKKYGGKYCVITFDDGWKDNYDNAFPILKKYNIPATIFLSVGHIGTKSKLWNEKVEIILHNNKLSFFNDLLIKSDKINKHQRVLLIDFLKKKFNSVKERNNEYIEMMKKVPIDIIENAIEKNATFSKNEQRTMLNWYEVKEMSENKITFGSHGLYHKILTKIDKKDAEKEIYESMQILNNKQLNFVPVFSYPNGNYNQEIINFVRMAGYTAAVSTNFETNNLKIRNRYALNRISVHNDVSKTPELLNLHLSRLKVRMNYKKIINKLKMSDK